MKMLTLSLSFVALTALVGCNTSEPEAPRSGAPPASP